MKGWECPKCGAVMAPWMEHCANCQPVSTPVYPQPWAPSDTGTGTPLPNPPYKITCTPPIVNVSNYGTSSGGR